MLQIYMPNDELTYYYSSSGKEFQQFTEARKKS